MKFLLIVVVTIASIRNADARPRFKRRLDQMSDMFHAVTGQAISMMNNYGSYCGLGGAGDPRDEIDRCCMDHDFCYDGLHETTCEDAVTGAVYLLPYQYTLQNKTVVCDENHVSACAGSLCQCDAAVIACWSQYLHQYDPQHKSQTIGTWVLGHLIDIARGETDITQSVQDYLQEKGWNNTLFWGR